MRRSGRKSKKKRILDESDDDVSEVFGLTHDENNESPEKVPEWFTEVLNEYCDVNETKQTTKWLPYKKIMDPIIEHIDLKEEEKTDSEEKFLILKEQLVQMKTISRVF